MKVTLSALALSVFLAATFAADITFTNKTVTFTNLEGNVYAQVDLVRADMDGLVWRAEASGGRVCYTNLEPAFMQALGIPTNRINLARARSERRAVASAQARAAAATAAQAQIAAQAKADALEAANAPARVLAKQREEDAQAIATLDAQIADAKIRLRRAEAQVHDYNAANAYNRHAQHAYVKDTERVKIEEAKTRLQQMKADFARKYKNRR